MSRDSTQNIRRSLVLASRLEEFQHDALGRAVVQLTGKLEARRGDFLPDLLHSGAMQRCAVVCA